MNNTRFKIFDIDEEQFVFDVEDFEILKIKEKQNSTAILNEISKKKNSEQSIEDFRNEGLSLLSKDNIFIISVDLAHGCTLNCKYCYLSAAENEKKLLTEERFIDILHFFQHIKTNCSYFISQEGESQPLTLS